MGSGLQSSYLLRGGECVPKPAPELKSISLRFDKIYCCINGQT